MWVYQHHCWYKKDLRTSETSDSRDSDQSNLFQMEFADERKMSAK